MSLPKVPSTYRFLQAAMLIVLAAAFATSFSSGSRGAGLLGYDPRFTSSLPLVCDVVAGAATVIHGRVRKDAEMRRLAGWFVLLPMLLSWAANSVDHVARAWSMSVGWTPAEQVGWVCGVIVFAGACPIAVAGLLHFSAKYAEFEQRLATPKPVRTPKPAAVPPPTAAKGSAGGDELAARREWERVRKAEQRARKKAQQANG